MKKNYTKQLLLLIALITSSFIYSQTNRVKVTVVWPSFAQNNEVQVWDPANNMLVSITSDGATQFNATYDLGCLAVAASLPDYYIKIFNTGGVAWSGSASVVVNVADAEEINDTGTNASVLGYQIDFTVNNPTLCNFPDTDGDGVIDFVDQDDDNDGILDIEEGLTLNSFNCAVPSLVFEGGAYETGGTSGLGGDVGSIYRFDNALEGYDVLLEITELDNTTIVQIDDDTDTPGTSTPSFLQSELIFTGAGVPGVTYKFTIVDDNSFTPSTSIFRIGGTTWDCDGTAQFQESVRYYNPSAYGLDNPTSLTADTYVDGAGITAGTVTYGGFSTNTILRSYFQFLSNTFTIRMQLKNSAATTQTRLYAMSFTQCDIFEYKAPTLTILNGQDTDGDGFNNELDLDADNDGIPDNIEFQPTIGYISPNFTGSPYENIDPITGIDTAYDGAGIDIVDTDGDGVPDFLDTDSDNDGKLDIAENGNLAHSITSTGDDFDDDGLNDIFETNGINDAVIDVNEDIEDPTDLSILLDADSDLLLGGDLDYRDAIDVYFESATIDFDGEDDYVDSTFDFSGMTQATAMAWIKLDLEFSDDGFVINQGDFVLNVYFNGRIYANVNNGSILSSPANALELNQWYHVATVFDSSLPSDNLKLYLNGELIDTSSGGSLLGPINASTDNFTIGKPSDANNYYFKGAIDEVRVFDIALTEDQLQQMVFQEIEENSTLVRGKIIPKNIADFTSNATISWANLQAYYPMTNILTGRTFDYSNYSRHAQLHNIETIQPQTAPMPYETKPGGDESWTNMNNWLHGNVWDIQDATTVKPWAIYQIHDNIQVSSSVLSYGLFIDDEKSLTISGDNAGADYEVNNGWYLELNGTIDLEGDSQLTQTVNSNLVTSATGKILRRQEGNSNKYWYNYWSSPVGALAATNNTNTAFSINMLKDGNENPLTFDTNWDNMVVGVTSSYWLYTFQNGRTYHNWVSINETSTIQPGVGYTQKGTGVTDPNDEQQYIFEGKPNNGTILVLADDVNNDSANEHLNDPDLGIYNYTSTLIGNPYPSAINAKTFINDNEDVIEGTVYIWEQWAGTSHLLDQYQGGTINYSSTAPAYQWNDPGLDVTGLAKTPTFYIPVGQGFFVEVINDGIPGPLTDTDDIEFNNGQRVFKKESESDGPTFFRSAETSTYANEDTIGTIRLELNVSNGNQRNFVLAFSESARWLRLWL